MSGYCPGCGNTMCLCASIEKDKTERKRVILEELSEMTQRFVDAQILISMELDENLEELTYFKSRIDVDGGGLYQMIFIHVDGPKIKLKPSKA